MELRDETYESRHGADEAMEAPAAQLRVPETPYPQAPPEAPRAFSALRHRNFRVFYVGHVLSLTGTWMQTTAQGWLVLELTNSEFKLGLVTAVASLPTLFLGLYAGVVADRRDKRGIILTAQCVMLACALAIAILTGLHAITYPVLLGLVFVLGTASAFEIPTRQSFFAELVGKEDLANAIALNSAAFNGSRIVGPAVAGALIGGAGIAACFYANAFSYVAVIAGLMMLRLPSFIPDPATGDASVMEHLREGLAYIRSDRVVRTLVWMIAAMSVTVFPYSMLLPVFARDVLHVGPRGLGMLLSAAGAGALVAGVLLAAGKLVMHRGRMIVGACFAFVTLLIGFALSPWYPLSLLLLAAASFMVILNNATLNALLQARVPDGLRGRVMSVYVFMFVGMTPLGSLQAGALARWINAPAALAIGCVAMLLIMGVVLVKVPELLQAE
jgi:predicted MFS family arabinose efflux permease